MSIPDSDSNVVIGREDTICVRNPSPFLQRFQMTNSKISPQHYSKYKIQPIDFIQANELDFAQGNIIKYVLRYKDKNGLEDLQKAKQNIDFLIKYLEKTNEKEPY